MGFLSKNDFFSLKSMKTSKTKIEQWNDQTYCSVFGREVGLINVLKKIGS
jgi:hypothetical protein